MTVVVFVLFGLHIIPNRVIDFVCRKRNKYENTVGKTADMIEGGRWEMIGNECSGGYRPF